MNQPDNEKNEVEDSRSCDTCGKEAAIVVDGVAWCASCLHARGSCCAESEMDDDD